MYNPERATDEVEFRLLLVYNKRYGIVVDIGCVGPFLRVPICPLHMPTRGLLERLLLYNSGNVFRG